MIAAHYALHCQPPWVAVDMDAAAKLLEDYTLTEKEKTDLPTLMAGYCRLIEEAELCFYGDTEEEAVSSCANAKPALVEQAPPEQTALLCLLADIRAAVGDPKGKLMQDGLVERCRKLREERNWMAHLLATIRDKADIRYGKNRGGLAFSDLKDEAQRSMPNSADMPNL